MKDYVEFVEEQIKKYTAYSKFGDDELSPWEINAALANYHDVSTGLLAETQRARWLLNATKRNFNVWWSQKYIESRLALNDPKLPATKWYAKQELEAHLMANNEVEYLKRQAELDEASLKVDFMEGLRSSWKSFDGMLVSLSNNMRSEMKSLSLQDRMNKDSRKRVLKEI